MLEFRINGRIIPLFPKTSIEVEYQTPMFDDSVVKGSRTLPFDFPITPESSEELGAPENLQSAASRQQTYPAELYDAGKLVIRGFFKLRTATTKKYSGNITESDGGVSAKLGDATLNFLNLGSETLPAAFVQPGTYYINAATYRFDMPQVGSPGKYQLQFAYLGTTVTAEYDAELPSALQALCGAINASSIPAKAIYNGKVLLVTPNVPGSYVFTFRVYLIEQGVFLWSAIPLQLLTYESIAPFPNASLANTSASGGYVFPMIHNPGFYAEENPNYSGYMNYYDGGYRHNEIGNFTRDCLVPMFFLHFIVRKLFELAGYTATGEFFDDATLDKLLVYNTRSLDRKIEEPDMLFNIYQKIIRYADHMPALAVSEFLNAVRKTFCLGYFFDARLKTVSVRFLREVIKGECKTDWTDKAQIDHEIEQTDETVSIGLAFALDADDETTKATPLDPVFDPYAGDESESVPFSPIVQETVSFPFTTGQAPISVPLTKQKGISPLFDSLKESKFAPRLLFWNGLTNGYPKASGELNGYKLQWNGAGGLHDRFWKEYLAFLQKTFDVNKNFNLSADDIYNFDFTQKVHVRGVNFFVKKISVAVPITKPAKLVLAAVR